MEIWKRAFPFNLRVNTQKGSIFFEKSFLGCLRCGSGGVFCQAIDVQ